MFGHFAGRRPSLATVLAAAALFVALGGPAAAVDLINGKTIKKGTVTGKQVKNRSLGEKELTAEAASALRAVPDGAVTGASVSDGSLGGADLAAGSVTRDRIAAGAIDASLVEDGLLAGPDVGRYVGEFTLDFGTVSNGDCAAWTTTSLTPVAPNQDLRDDAIALTPTSSFPTTNALTFWAQPAGADTITVTLCNADTAPVVIGQRTFRFLSVDVL